MKPKKAAYARPKGVGVLSLKKPSIARPLGLLNCFQKDGIEIKLLPSTGLKVIDSTQSRRHARIETGIRLQRLPYMTARLLPIAHYQAHPFTLAYSLSVVLFSSQG